MDRRNLTFIVAFSIALFGVNIFFHFWNQQEKQRWKAENAAYQETLQERRLEEYKTKSLSLNELNVVPLFVEGSSAPISHLAQFEGTWFGVSGINNPPEKAYIKDNWGEKTSLHLVIPPKQRGDLLVYTTSEKTRDDIESHPPFHVPSLSSFEGEDLHLVTLNSSSPKDFIAIVNDGSTEFPVESPESSALVFAKYNDQFLPVASYDFDDQTFRELSHYHELEKFTLTNAKGSSWNQADNESLYILENRTLQLVISTQGGALKEINLPFMSEGNNESVVREIQFDRDILEQSPANARFPLFPYHVPGSEELKEPSEGGYYPLLRRDLIGVDGRTRISELPPTMYALNVIGDFPEVSELKYSVKEFTESSIVLEAKQGLRTIRKRFSLPQDSKASPYCFNFDIEVQGDHRALWLSTGIPEVEMASGSPLPILKYRITKNGELELIKLDPPKEPISLSSIKPDWATSGNVFFGVIMDPLSALNSGLKSDSVSGLEAPSRLTLIDASWSRFKADTMPGYRMLLPLSKKGLMSFRVYSGPFAKPTLTQVDATYKDPKTGESPDYIECISFAGWFAFILKPFSQAMMFLMRMFYSLSNSWVLSIFLLTLTLRGVMFPLNSWSFKSMKVMQELSPEIKRIQDKYKKEPQKAQLEIVQLYREKKVNPLSGCFPILLQLPFLFAMLDLLKSTFELRGAPFISGWIDNLAAPDVLFSWSQPIPFVGTEFHLLPVLLGLTMLVQQLLNATPSKEGEATEQQRQQRAMGNIMTVMFTVMFYHLPSGLNLYWLFSSILGMLQQYYTKTSSKAKKSKA